MRHLAVFAILVLAACIREPAATEPDPFAGTYTLTSVDRITLPALADYSSGSRYVVSGYLTLQPDGHFVLSEGDSLWNGRTFSRQGWTEGGVWMADGSTLTLSDTSTQTMDPYGAGTTTYLGSIAASGVLLTVWSDDGTESSTYLYTR